MIFQIVLAFFRQKNQKWDFAQKRLLFLKFLKHFIKTPCGTELFKLNDGNSSVTLAELTYSEGFYTLIGFKLLPKIIF